MPGVQQHFHSSGDRCSCFLDIPKFHRSEPLEHFPRMNSCKLSSPSDAAANFQSLRSFSVDSEPLEHFPSMNSCKLSSPRDAAANFQRLGSFSVSESEGAPLPKNYSLENFLYSFPMVSSLPRGGASDSAVAALQKFLPSNNEEATWPAVDAYSFDEFRMYEFKVRRCARGRAHDWTECPFAHPGEKARRRDPRKFHYSGTGCPDLRKGSCRRGDACEFAHGVFECWLHPARYRTQPCKDGRSCRRRVCFFAHTPEQLRLLPGGGGASNFSRQVLDFRTGGSYDGSPFRYSAGDFYDGGGHSVPSPYKTKAEAAQISSPTSTLAGLSPPGSPPLSLGGSRAPAPAVSAAFPSTSLKAAAFPNLNNQYDPSGIMKSLQRMDLNRGPQHQHFPTAMFDENGEGSSTSAWQDLFNCAPRVESGNGVRAMIYARLGKEAPSSLEDGNEYPDLSWVNELVM